MGKLLNFTILIAGVDLLFYLAGLLPSTAPTSTLMLILLNPTNIANLSGGIASYFNIAITAVTLIGTITLGFFSGSDKRFIAAAPFAAFMVNILLDILNVVAVVMNASPLLALIVFSPFLIGLYIVGLEWALGQDN